MADDCIGLKQKKTFDVRNFHENEASSPTFDNLTFGEWTGTSEARSPPRHYEITHEGLRGETGDYP